VLVEGRSAKRNTHEHERAIRTVLHATRELACSVIQAVVPFDLLDLEIDDSALIDAVRARVAACYDLGATS
jgi:hypothetical protein